MGEHDVFADCRRKLFAASDKMNQATALIQEVRNELLGEQPSEMLNRKEAVIYAIKKKPEGICQGDLIFALKSKPRWKWGQQKTQNCLDKFVQLGIICRHIGDFNAIIYTLPRETQ